MMSSIYTRILALCLLLPIFLQAEALKEHEEYDNRMQSIYFSPLLDFYQSMESQIRKLDITMTKMFKTFILSKEITTDNMKDVLQFYYTDNDELIQDTPQLHVEEMMIDLWKSNDKEAAAKADSNTDIVKRRRLEELVIEQECENGVREKINVTMYYCTNQQISEERYNDLKGDTEYDCHTEVKQRELCRCPVDYSSDRCENFLGIKCNTKVKSPNVDCATTDSEDYVASCGGYPRCNIVEKNQKVQISLDFECSIDNTTGLAYEGFKHQLLKKRIDNEEEAHKFEYTVNTSGLILSKDPEFILQLSIINWLNISNPFQINNTIPHSKLNARNSLAPFELEITEDVISTHTLGRIHIEIGMIINQGQAKNFNDTTFYLDLQPGSYTQEKENIVSKNDNNFNVIVLSSLAGVVLIFVIALLLLKCKSHRERDSTSMHLLTDTRLDS